MPGVWLYIRVRPVGAGCVVLGVWCCVCVAGCVVLCVWCWVCGAGCVVLGVRC